MMKLKIIFIFSLLILISCSEKDTNKAVIWVSGFKATCNAGAGKSNCLLINRSDYLTEDTWELFYGDVEGFEFQEGTLKKIEILAQEGVGQVAADQSKLTYTLVKELDQRKDIRYLLRGEWKLNSLNGETLNDTFTPPTLGFNLVEMKINGHGGCNSYNGSIKQLGLESMVFGDLINTLKICAEDTIETVYLSALNNVRKYSIDVANLNLKDDNGKTILRFKKQSKTSNKIRIHDLWSVVRIEGSPINRMITVPRLEVNTKEMKVYGNDGCNEYFGTLLKLTENSISFGDLGTTRKMCDHMEILNGYNNSLSKVRAYRFDKDLLILLNEVGEETLALMKID